MRFWGKNKYGDKKTSRDKMICGSDSLDGDYGDTGPLLGEGALHKYKIILINNNNNNNKNDNNNLKIFHITENSHWSIAAWYSLPSQQGRRTCRRPAVLIWCWIAASETWRRTRSRLLRWSEGAVLRSPAWLWNLLSGRTTRCRSSPAPTTTGAWTTSSWRRWRQTHTEEAMLKLRVEFSVSPYWY